MKSNEIKKQATVRDELQGNKGIKYKIYENLSTGVVKLLMKTAITANEITILGTIFPFLSVLLFSFGNIWYGLLGIIFLYLGELMDAVDGTLARCKQTCSKLQSGFLGNLYHSLPYPFLFFGISIGVYVNSGNVIYLLIGAFATMCQLTVAMVRFLSSSVMMRHGMSFDVNEDKIFNKEKSFIKKMFEAPMKHLRPIILVCLVFGLFKYFIMFYFVFNFVKVVGYMYTIYNSFKRLESN